jgi:hypothetical protein
VNQTKGGALAGGKLEIKAIVSDVKGMTSFCEKLKIGALETAGDVKMAV